MKKYLCFVLFITLIKVCIDVYTSKDSVLPEENIIEEVEEIQFNEDHLLEMDLDIHSLILALNYYEIEHKEIVLAQAILETGWFDSYNCKRRNNLFGLYNSRRLKMHSFEHWSVSVKKYKKWIQRRYKETDKDYYHFLKRIKYAEDPEYISKLKKVVKNNNLSKFFEDGTI